MVVNSRFKYAIYIYIFLVGTLFSKTKNVVSYYTGPDISGNLSSEINVGWKTIKDCEYIYKGTYIGIGYPPIIKVRKSVRTYGDKLNLNTYVSAYCGYNNNINENNLFAGLGIYGGLSYKLCSKNNWNLTIYSNLGVRPHYGGSINTIEVEIGIEILKKVRAETIQN